MPSFDPFASSLPAEDPPSPPTIDLPTTTEPPSDTRSTPPPSDTNPNDTDIAIPPTTTASHDFAPPPTFNPQNNWGIQAALSGIPGVEIEDNRVPRPPGQRLNYPPHPLNCLDLSGRGEQLAHRLQFTRTETGRVRRDGSVGEGLGLGLGDGMGYRTRFSEGSGNLYPPMEEEPEPPQGFWDGNPRAAPIPGERERERGRGMERRMEVGRELNERIGLGGRDLTSDTDTSSESPGLVMARPGGRTVADRVREEEEEAARARERGGRDGDGDVDVYAGVGMAPGLGIVEPELGRGVLGGMGTGSPNFDVRPWSPVVSSGAITTGSGSEEGVGGGGRGVEAGELGVRLEEAAAAISPAWNSEARPQSVGVASQRSSPADDDILHSALSPPAVDWDMSRQSMVVPGVPVGVTEMPTGLEFSVERAISALDLAIARLDRRAVAILQGIRVAFPDWFNNNSTERSTISGPPNLTGAAPFSDRGRSRVRSSEMPDERDRAILHSILPISPPPPMDFRTVEARDAWMATQFRVLSKLVVEDLAPMEEALWGVGPLQGLGGVRGVSRESGENEAEDVIERVRTAGERVRSVLEPLRISRVVRASSTHAVQYPSLPILSEAEMAARLNSRISDVGELDFPAVPNWLEDVPSAALSRIESAPEREFTMVDSPGVQRYELNPFYAAGLTRPPLQTSELTNQLRDSPTAAPTGSASRGSINATPISPHTGFPEISTRRPENVAPTTPVQYPDLSRHMLQGPVPGSSIVERLGSDDSTALQRDSLRGSATMTDLVKRRRGEDEEEEQVREREGGSPPKKRMEDE
ncbi:hypothetical protein LTR97_012447 [Elasticomyces elasticus]|uniref:Uncharacterized protein n=1 Tax=Elasticomyces elasticus TaxID=574655 RepID=A0AAN7W227_9PEZI|nr:hypothetical protein LTR97_012447 [Elasticomyces elasticus]